MFIRFLYTFENFFIRLKYNTVFRLAELLIVDFYDFTFIRFLMLLIWNWSPDLDSVVNVFRDV